MEIIIGWGITGVLSILVVIMGVINMRHKRKTKKMLEDWLAEIDEREDLFSKRLFTEAEMSNLMELNEETNPLLAETWRDTLSISDEVHEELLERSLVEYADLWREMRLD